MFVYCSIKKYIVLEYRMPEEPTESFRKGRLIFLLAAALVFLSYIIAKFASLSRLEVVPLVVRNAISERGSIVDRAGRPFAVQTMFYNVGVSPRRIEDAAAFCQDVAPQLSMSKEDVSRRIEAAKDRGASFVYLKKKVKQNSYETLQRIAKDKKYSFIRFDKVPGRIYPEGALASTLVGFMGDDGKGLTGLEYSQDNVLSSRGGTEAANIYLTIDAALQYKLEQIAHKALENTGAECMMLIASEAKTGEILSYVSLPSCDLNNFAAATAQEMIDLPAMTAYEPGSVFKIFTVAITYDRGLLRADDTFYCDGLYERTFASLGGRRHETIRIKCLEHHGSVTPMDALRFSCNDALCQISDRIDEDEFISKIRALGFGKRTNLEIPGESAGSVKDPNSRLWSARSKPTIAIGQEISVSALQMVKAASAIANGGVAVPLTVIKRITRKDGSTLPLPKREEDAAGKRLFKKTTADYVLRCMETTARTGTGSRAQLGDIKIGVKTGTAQMADKERGGYSDTDFLSNCMAIFPIDDPKIVLYIVIEKAKGETYAGRIVAPVIAEAADVIIDHLGLARGDAENVVHSGTVSLPPPAVIRATDSVPNLIGLHKKDLLPLLENQNFRLQINGSGWVKSQNPEPGTPITSGMTIEVNLQ